ncbi:type II toxin-antitoxin system RelE/ParE family toxin [Paenibacillus alginolyticus]|uniref:Type II toxin-antitoxin system RelE/ParE family toxin n=1 Tax=Paenibacillus alginolyticus TaxID=59839 RepID=A0ABT4GPI4_9BACL|nr:type II toxin-antitoxin system RelE/ParE family toxin [Paenibacillus alginolyticus]MCY9667494.1 type II toxin-antitoxin system RelE/ParE family toxin [Paenibacillus alginolyticus]MCY9698132.1 type II toxin-antitoxin system RelE/ParE family toxin [Paenibacillus alginolyticus]MEC0145309.1 type II toxin-antitoxin system RelE/ParE family toxin [Paenibacillus alginolyticus]
MAQLIWSPRSLADLEIIYEYIQQDSIDNARKFINELIEEVITIPEFPLAGRVVPEFKDQKTREKIYKNYRMIYRIQAQDVELITILHQARRLNKQDY